jgi:hypothetical protein
MFSFSFFPLFDFVCLFCLHTWRLSCPCVCVRVFFCCLCLSVSL